MKASHPSSRQSYLALPEMRSLWIFLVIAVAIVIANFLYMPIWWAIGISAVLLALGAMVFRNNLMLVKSNLATRASSRRTESIIFSLADGVIAYDNDFKITVFNPTAETIFNLKANKVVGEVIGPEKAQNPELRLLTQVIFPSLAPVVQRRSESGAYPQIVDLSFTDPALELRVATDRVTDTNGTVVGFVKIIHDRTREIEIYQSKSEFITVAAHQLRTPLTGVHWTFEALNSSKDIAPADKELVSNGLILSNKLLKIVNDLLDVSKIEEGRFGYNFANVNLVDFLSDILENANIMAKQYGVSLYFDRGNEPSALGYIDASKLGLALSNLLDNAIKYNVKNGSVTVRIARVPNQPYVQISVEDTGVGVPEDAMGKLFTKFFRADNVVKFQTEGTGLGLYIAKNVVKRHGGAIGAESTLGRGSKFTITLPTDPKLVPPTETSVEDI
ncbi:MAG: ATP-binding protein [Patescibacteria group bacterium]|nr:ATP-binding protein [Patescibacteria group bacterium]MCL5224108.1 ATP-binding protein [Patescibacteria group bacterium]